MSECPGEKRGLVGHDSKRPLGSAGVFKSGRQDVLGLFSPRLSREDTSHALDDYGTIIGPLKAMFPHMALS